MANSAADKTYKQALKIARGGNPNLGEVFTLLNEAADGGSGAAAAAIASWYANGQHVKKSTRLAVQWFQKAAALGSSEGFYGIAVAYHEGKGGLGKDDCRAFQNYLRAAIRGDKEAIREVGRCYWYGSGVQEDRETAEIWLHRADELGVAD